MARKPKALRVAKLPKLPTKTVLISKAFKALREREFDGMCTYGSIREDGTHIKNTFTGCVSDLTRKNSNYGRGGTGFNLKGNRVFYNVMPAPRTGRETQGYTEFCKWLVTTSPWAKMKYVYKTSAKMVADYGFVIYNEKCPSNVMVNMLIASRQSYEHQHVLTRWWQFVKAGVDGNVAFIFANALLQYNTWGKGPGHNSVDGTTITRVGAENFCHGVAPKGNQPFTEGTTYTPCNACWYPSVPVKGDDYYFKYLDQTYPKKAPAVQGSRMFLVQNKDDGPYGNGPERTAEEWIEIALAETKRIYAHDVIAEQQAAG